MNNKKETLSKVLCVIGILLFIGLPVAFAINGHIVKSKAMGRCTEETKATVYDVYVEDYLYAPYHGGIVKTKYNTYVTYEIPIGDIHYYVRLKAYYNRVDYPEEISVKYNPNDYTEFFFKMAEWDESEGDAWWSSDNLSIAAYTTD